MTQSKTIPLHPFKTATKDVPKTGKDRAREQETGMRINRKTENLNTIYFILSANCIIFALKRKF